MSSENKGYHSKIDDLEKSKQLSDILPQRQNWYKLDLHGDGAQETQPTDRSQVEAREIYEESCLLSLVKGTRGYLLYLTFNHYRIIVGLFSSIVTKGSLIITLEWIKSGILLPPKLFGIGKNWNVNHCNDLRWGTSLVFRCIFFLSMSRSKSLCLCLTLWTFLHCPALAVPCPGSASCCHQVHCYIHIYASFWTKSGVYVDIYQWGWSSAVSGQTSRIQGMLTYPRHFLNPPVYLVLSFPIPWIASQQVLHPIAAFSGSVVHFTNKNFSVW